MAYSSRHIAYTKRSISEFLAPSRRSHPHVEPLLAPYKFFDKQIGAKSWLSLQGMHFLWKHSLLEASMCLLSFDKFPSVDSYYEASLLVKKCPKAPFFPLISFPKAFVFYPLSLPFYFPSYPSNSPKIPFNFFPLPFVGHFPPLSLYRFPLKPSKSIKRGKRPTFRPCNGAYPLSRQPLNHFPTCAPALGQST